MIEANPVNVTTMIRRGVDRRSAVAAAAAEAEGKSPREQLDAAKAASRQRGLGYAPHQGARERARRLRRINSVKVAEIGDKL